MGRISDIVLRGLQFEAEQETRELENEGRRLQMDKIIRENVAVGRRMNPKYAESWDRFTNPETPTSELGKWMANIPPEDFPDLINDRNTMLEAHTRNKFATAKYIAEWEQKFAIQEKRFELQEAARKEGERERDERIIYQQGEISRRATESAGLQRDLRNATTQRQVDAAELAERNRRAGNLDEIQNQISLNITKYPFEALSIADEDTQKALKKKLNGKDPADVRGAILTASENAAELIRVGVPPEKAYKAVASGIDLRGATVVVTPVAVPADLPTTRVQDEDDGPSEADLDAAVERGVMNALNAGKADTPELRRDLRARAAKLLGGK